MPNLEPRHQDLLDRIVRSGGVPAREVDGRLVRRLRTAGLVTVDRDRVVPTVAGRQQARPASKSSDRSRLNSRQEDLLWRILRLRHVPAQELDGRVARPLVARGLVTISDDHVVSPTSAGRVYFEQTPVPARRRKAGVEHARAVAIRAAVRRLEVAVPPGSEVLVGNIMAAAEDVMDAFLRHARGLEGRS